MNKTWTTYNHEDSFEDDQLDRIGDNQKENIVERSNF